MTFITSEGILLRSYPYSESSQILRVLTPGLGIVSLVARGTRKRGGAGEAPVQTFEEALFTFTRKPGRELHRLREVQVRGAPFGLAGNLARLTGASLVAELLLAHHLEGDDDALYQWVRRVLAELCTVPAPEVLGWTLSGGGGPSPSWGSCPSWAGASGAAAGGTTMKGGLGTKISTGSTSRREGSSAVTALRPATSLGSDPVRGLSSRRSSEGCPPLIHRGRRAHLALLEAFAVEHLVRLPAYTAKWAVAADRTDLLDHSVPSPHLF